MEGGATAPGTNGPRRLADFAGRWRLTRRIADFRSGGTLRLAGRADFRPGGQDGIAGLSEEEQGLLRPGPGPGLVALRATFWREPEPGRIVVTFADGRAFHAFRLGARATARHDCAPDLYRVTYDFRRWPEWHVLWRATGPAKDYASLSRYRPDTSA